MNSRVKIRKQKPADSYTVELLTEIEQLKIKVEALEAEKRYNMSLDRVISDTVSTTPHNLKYTPSGLPIYRYQADRIFETRCLRVYNPVTRTSVDIRDEILMDARDATPIIRQVVDDVLRQDYRPPDEVFSELIGDLDLHMRRRF